MSVDVIGIHKIITPEGVNKLTFEDGSKLAKEYIKPLTASFLKKQVKVQVLFPRAVNGGTSRVTPRFFVGLFEELFEAYRDEHFPDLKVAAARKRIKPVAGVEHEEKHIFDVLQDCFAVAHETYDPMERDLYGSIKIGFINEDGSCVFTNVSEDRHISGETDDINLHYAFVAKVGCYYKALDRIF